MKNWKTTITGVLAGIALLVYAWATKGAIDPQTLLIAGGLITGGVLSSDAKTTTIVQEALPLANTIVDDLSINNPSPMLKDIHAVLSTIAENTKVNAAPPVAAATIINDVKS